MSFDKSKISIKEAAKILKSIYNLDGEISLLDGEIDFNFKVVLNNSKKYLLKISRSSFEQEYIDYQVLLLEHLNKNSKIELPKLVLSTDNKKSSIIQDVHGYDRSVRLMSWIDGRLWSSVNPITKSLRYKTRSEVATPWQHVSQRHARQQGQLKRTAVTLGLQH